MNLRCFKHETENQVETLRNTFHKKKQNFSHKNTILEKSRTPSTKMMKDSIMVPSKLRVKARSSNQNSNTFDQHMEHLYDHPKENALISVPQEVHYPTRPVDHQRSVSSLSVSSNDSSRPPLDELDLPSVPSPLRESSEIKAASLDKQMHPLLQLSGGNDDPRRKDRKHRRSNFCFTGRP